MAFPFKSGGDFYTQELLRVRLQNFDGDLPEYGTGSIYHNTSTGLNTSDRIRYRGKTKWYSVANIDDIQRLEDLIAELDEVSGGNITSLLNRLGVAEQDIDKAEVRIKAIEDDYLTDSDKKELSGSISTLEGYFTDGVANDSAKLGGQLPSYYATQSAFSALQEKVSAFLDGDVDSDAVLENLKEIQAFLDNYDGATSLADMFDAVQTDINTRAKQKDLESAVTRIGGLEELTENHTAQIADRYTKAESDARFLKLTGGTIYKENSPIPLEIKSKDAFAGLGFKIGDAGRANIVYYGGLDWRVTNESYQVEHFILHHGNYSNLITDLNNNLNVPSITIGGITLSVVSGKLQIDGDVFATGEVAAKGKGQEGGENTGGGFQLFDETNSWESYEASMQDWILTAYHGKLFNDRISLLENKATKVEVSNLLSSGTKIATIKVDNNSYDVLAPFADAYTKTESDARYLLQSGGTIGGNLIVNGALAVTSNITFYQRVSIKSGAAIDFFDVDNVARGILAPYVENNYELSWCDNILWHVVLHSGNIGKYALKTDGSNTMNGGIKWSSSTLDSTNAQKKSGLRLFAFIDKEASPNDSIYWSTLSAVTDYVGFQIGSHGSKTSNMHPVFRKMYDDGTWSDWRTLAFTDSDITGNAASATKLATARKIWGNYFDGSKNIGDAGSNEWIYLNSGGEGIYLGANVISWHNSDDAWTKTILFFNQYGNVTIGEGDLAGTDAKLFVDGVIKSEHIYAASIRDYDGGFGYYVGSRRLGIGAADGGVMMSTYDESPITFHSASTEKMRICSSGNVGIGTTNPQEKLHVDGVIRAKDNILTIGTHGGYALYGGVRDGEALSLETYNSDASWQAWAIRVAMNGAVTLASSLIVEGVTTFKDNVFLSTNGIYLNGTGISWHNNYSYVSSLIGFESDKIKLNQRVLVGGATDDGSTALQVNGNARFGEISVISASSEKYIQFNHNGNTWYVQALEQDFCVGGTYSKSLAINQSGDVTVRGRLSVEGATILSSLIVNNAATFNGGVDIPMGQSLKIGDATIKYEGGALKVDKSIHSEGEVSAKGKGTEGAGGTTEGGGNAMKAAFNIPMGSTSHICEHNFHTREVTVCIYEDSGDYQQVLADVYLDDENNVRIQFGSATDVPHRAIIMA